MTLGSRTNFGFVVIWSKGLSSLIQAANWFFALPIILALTALMFLARREVRMSSVRTGSIVNQCSTSCLIAVRLADLPPGFSPNCS